MSYIRRRLIQFLVKKLLVAVTEDDILRVTNKGWFYQNTKLSPEEVAQLKEDAEGFYNSVLWNHMKNEVRYLANLQMFEKGISADNTLFGRAMLHNLQMMELFIQNCKNKL